MAVAVPEGQDAGPALAGFNFHVSIDLPNLTALQGRLVCEGAFADVTGLEASMDVKTIRAGGSNAGAHQRAGAVSYPTVVLRRGMTVRRDLWLWWSAFTGGAGGAPYRSDARATVHVAQLDELRRPALVWILRRAMPVKIKSADLSARSGDVAIEELHLVHEGLSIETADGEAL